MHSGVFEAADIRLAQALLRLDESGVEQALADGASAYREPFNGLSWAFIPVCLKAKQDGMEASWQGDAVRLVRRLLQAGAPTTGLHRLAGAGVPFSKQDYEFFLDNWLWRDSSETTALATRLMHQDDVLSMMIASGSVDTGVVLPNGVPLLEHICFNDMYRSVAAMGVVGVDVNCVVDFGGEPVTLIEAVASKGFPMTVNALLLAGAYYDRDNLIARGKGYSLQMAALVERCVRRFEAGEPIEPDDLWNQAKTMLQPVQPL